MNYALLSRILSPWLHSVLCTVQLWPINILNWYHDQDQNLQPKTFAFLTCLRDINWSQVIHVTFLYTVELFVAIANAFTTKIRLTLSCHPFLYHISSGFCLNIEALVCESAIKMRTIQLLLETVLSLRIRFCQGKCYNYTGTIVYFNPLVRRFPSGVYDTKRK